MHEACTTMNNIERRIFSADFNFAEERRSYSAEFKAQVALEALRGNKSNIEIALEFAIHPNQVSLWKQHLLNNIIQVFENCSVTVLNMAAPPEKSHAKIGQLIAENDFLTKVLGRNTNS